MADTTPRIPSLDDIRWLFEQLPDDRRRDDERNAPTSDAPTFPPDGGHEESSHE